MECENIKTEILASVNLKFEEKLQDLKMEIPIKLKRHLTSYNLSSRKRLMTPMSDLTNK